MPPNVAMRFLKEGLGGLEMQVSGLMFSLVNLRYTLASASA
jgi:hypothetical protein